MNQSIFSMLASFCLYGSAKTSIRSLRATSFCDRRTSRISRPSRVELILIRASVDISQELGIELNPSTEKDTAEILNDLRMRNRHPIEPLFTGEWR